MNYKYLLALVALFASSSLLAQTRLSFKENGFVIAQFTDLHWDNKSNKCSETASTIQHVLESEKPDLVVLTGDVVTEKPAIEGWESIIALLENAKINYTVTLGNHDAEVLEKDEIFKMLLESPYYIGNKRIDNVDGVGNSVIPIYDSHTATKIESILYCIDSNDYPTERIHGPYDWIHFNQVEWYRKQSAHFTKQNNNTPLPSLAFFHIPLIEYKEVQEDSKTFGVNKEKGVSSSRVNSGIFASFIDMKDVMGVFVGHDHNNDFIGINKGIALAYGRVTGADAYGQLNRGARIIKLIEGKAKFDTWISTKEGREPAFYYPSGFNEADSQSMNYLPAVNSKSTVKGVHYNYYEGECKKVADIAACKKISSGTMPNISIKDAPIKDYFAFDFTSLILIPEDGVYRFYTYSDDGSQLYIDEELVVDNDGGHSARRAEGIIALKKGFHKLKVLYFERYMGETLEVGYSSRYITETILSDEQLYLPN